MIFYVYHFFLIFYYASFYYFAPRYRNEFKSRPNYR